MLIARADHAERIRVDPELAFQLEPEFERGTRIFVLEHRVSFRRRGGGDIADVEPSLEVGEFVVRREEGVGLAVALDLGHLHNRLVTDARLGVGRVHRPPVTGLGREHETIAQIAVVRDGEDLTARQLLVPVHVLPEGLRILAVEGGERNDLLHAVDAVAENDGAMQVVALVRRRSFKWRNVAETRDR